MLCMMSSSTYSISIIKGCAFSRNVSATRTRNHKLTSVFLFAVIWLRQTAICRLRRETELASSLYFVINPTCWVKQVHLFLGGANTSWHRLTNMAETKMCSRQVRPSASGRKILEHKVAFRRTRHTNLLDDHRYSGCCKCQFLWDFFGDDKLRRIS